MKIKLNSEAPLLSALCLALCISCGKNTPMEPPSRKHPELIPLAAGAKWVYSYEERYKPSDIVYPTYEMTTKGVYILEIKSSNTFPDSIVYHAQTATLDSLDGAEFDRTEYDLLFFNDSLWYRLSGDDSLTYMLPGTFSPTSVICLTLIVPPVIRAEHIISIDGACFSNGEKSVGVIKYINSYSYSETGNIKAATLNKKGVIEIYFQVYAPSSHSAYQLRDIQLMEYTPGTR